MEYLNEIQKAITKELEASTRTIMAQKGVPKDTALSKSIDWQFIDGHFVLVSNDYYVWVDAGRKRGVKQVPAQALITWMKKNGISPRGKMTMNSLAFLIARSIKLNGIKGKHYDNAVIEAATDIIAEDIAEVLSWKIVNEIVDAIQN